MVSLINVSGAVTRVPKWYIRYMFSWRLLATTKQVSRELPDVQAMVRWIVTLNLPNVDLARLPFWIGRSSLCCLFGNVNLMLHL
jgi:hypothetical protein